MRKKQNNWRNLGKELTQYFKILKKKIMKNWIIFYFFFMGSGTLGEEERTLYNEDIIFIFLQLLSWTAYVQ